MTRVVISEKCSGSYGDSLIAEQKIAKYLLDDQSNRVFCMLLTTGGFCLNYPSGEDSERVLHQCKHLIPTTIIK